MNINDGNRSFYMRYREGWIAGGIFLIETESTPPLGSQVRGTWNRAWHEYVEQRDSLILPGPDGKDHMPVITWLPGDIFNWCWCEENGNILTDSENHILHPFWMKFPLTVVSLEKEVPVNANWSRREPSKLVWDRKKPSSWQFVNSKGMLIRN